MGHWYSKDGKPQHFTSNTKGESRDSTLRDARKHGWYPSVTEIINTLDKPALVNWKIKQVLMSALTLPALPDEDVDSYYSRVMVDAFKESTDARDKGSEIHNAIEGWWNGHPLPQNDVGDIADKAIDAIIKFCGDREFIPEKTVVGEGYGGMVDLHNNEFVIDYKSKEISDSDWIKYETGKAVKLAYPENCMQLSAYDRALGGNPRRLVNVFIDRTIAGRVIIHEWKENMYDRFLLLVKYWQISKNYFPDAITGE